MSVTDADIELVLAAIADGASSVTAACRKAGVCDRATFFRRVRDNPDLARRWQHAQEERAEVQAEQYERIERLLEEGRLDPSTSKILLESLRWKMARNDSRRFSDKVRSEVTGAEGRPLIPEMPRNQSPLDDLEVARWLAFTLEKQSRSPLLLEASST